MSPMHAATWASRNFGLRAGALDPENIVRVYVGTTRWRTVIHTMRPIKYPPPGLHRYRFAWSGDLETPATCDVLVVKDLKDLKDPEQALRRKLARRVVTHAQFAGPRLPEVDTVLTHWRGRVSTSITNTLTAYRIAEECVERYTWNGDAAATVEESGAITLEARSRRVSATFSPDGVVLLRTRGVLP